LLLAAVTPTFRQVSDQFVNRSRQPLAVDRERRTLIA
jgi:hypothetical protein